MVLTPATALLRVSAFGQMACCPHPWNPSVNISLLGLLQVPGGECAHHEASTNSTTTREVVEFTWDDDTVMW